MKILYEMGRRNSRKSFQELFRVTSLTRKYGVYSFASDFLKYVDEQVIMCNHDNIW